MYLLTPTLKRPWCCLPTCKIAKEKYDENKDTNCCYPIKPDTNNDEQRPIDAFFENVFYEKIKDHRVLVICIFALIFVIFGYFASQLEPDPNVCESVSYYISVYEMIY